MRGRTNVRLHFVGHADSLPLRGELINIYRDTSGCRGERAGTVAEYCQRALNLPPKPSPTKDLVKVGRLPAMRRKKADSSTGAWKCRSGTTRSVKSRSRRKWSFPARGQHQGLPDRDRLSIAL